MIIDHEKGYNRLTTTPIIDRGASGAWDDYFVYAAVPFEFGGERYIAHAGSRNVGDNPRLQNSIGLAKLVSGSWVKQGKVIDKSAVSPYQGLAPFSVRIEDGVVSLYCSVFSDRNPQYRAAVIRSTDLVNWYGLTYLSGMPSPAAHAPCVIDDPHDEDKLLIFVTRMNGNEMRMFKGWAYKTDDTAWFDLTMMANWQAIYPSVRWNGEAFEIAYARQVQVDPQKYNTFLSITDGTYLTLGVPILPHGASGAFDSNYVTTPSLYGNEFFYSGRNAVNDGYKGIGWAQEQGTGSLLGWDEYSGTVGRSTVPKTGNYGARIVGSGMLEKKGFRDKAYSVWIYDDLDTTASSQNTFRLVPDADAITVAQLTVGFVRSISSSKYVYRLRNGSWVTTAVNRTAGWHQLSFEVGDNVVIKLDGATLATDTAYNTSAAFMVQCVGGATGTAYIDDLIEADL